MATSKAIRFRDGVQLSHYSPSLICALPLLTGSSPRGSLHSFRTSGLLTLLRLVREAIRGGHETLSFSTNGRVEPLL